MLNLKLKTQFTNYSLIKIKIMKNIHLIPLKEETKNKYSEEDLKTAYFSGIKTTGEGWNGEYANGNNPSIEKEFQKEFQEWLKQFKKKKYERRNSNNTFIRN